MKRNRERAAFEHPDSLKRNRERAVAKQIERETNRGNEANPEGQNKIELSRERSCMRFGEEEPKKPCTILTGKSRGGFLWKLQLEFFF